MNSLSTGVKPMGWPWRSTWAVGGTDSMTKRRSTHPVKRAALNRTPRRPIIRFMTGTRTFGIETMHGEPRLYRGDCGPSRAGPIADRWRRRCRCKVGPGTYTPRSARSRQHREGGTAGLAERLYPLRTLLFATLTLAVAGCGSTHNPSYFPYLLPPGDIEQTHAKPPGKGYFADFDPHARCLVVRPVEGTSPVRSQVVLIAT